MFDLFAVARPNSIQTSLPTVRDNQKHKTIQVVRISILRKRIHVLVYKLFTCGCVQSFTITFSQGRPRIRLFALRQPGSFWCWCLIFYTFPTHRHLILRINSRLGLWSLEFGVWSSVCSVFLLPSSFNTGMHDA